MLALVKKDLVTIRRAGLMQLALSAALMCIFVFALKDVSIAIGVIAMVAYSMTLSTVSYDEMSHFDAYALAMPISRKDVVRAKYLLFCTVITLASVFMAVFGTLGSIYIGYEKLHVIAVIAMVAVVEGIFIFVTALTLPFVFKFGAERGRIFMVVAMLPFVAMVLMLSASGNTDNIISATGTGMTLLIAGAILFVAIAFIVSYNISVKIYTKREF